MPSIWSSSERPIFVRMVWVDGVRHAILSQDDPLLNVKVPQQRSQTIPTIKGKNYPRKFEPYKSATQTGGDGCCFDSCFVKLHFVVKKISKSNSSSSSSSKGSRSSTDARTRGIARQQSAPICARIVHNSLDFRYNEFLKFETSDDEGNDTNKYDCIVWHREDVFDEKDKIKIKSEKQVKHTKVLHMNTLSERVLQWLDLSGKVRDFQYDKVQQKPNDSVEISKISKRELLSFQDNASSGIPIKVVAPMQLFMLQERIDDEALEIVEKQFLETNTSKNREVGKKLQYGKLSVNMEKHEDISKNSSRARYDASKDNSERSQSMWTLPGKLQLHIFMPNLKPAEIQWISSQESLFYE